MNVKKVFWLLLLHFELFVLGTLIFILLFNTNLFRNITVFFYRGILLLLVASLFTMIIAIIVNLVSSRNIFTVRDVLLSLVLVFCINLVFFTHVPVTGDRSISVFLLGYMSNQSDKILSNDEITRAFVDRFVYEYGSMDKRLDEQILSGNIFKDKNGYRITKRGIFLIKLFNLVADIFVIDKKVVSPK